MRDSARAVTGLAEPTLEPPDDQGEVGVQLARTIEGGKQLLLVGGAISDARDTVAVDLAPDELAEHLGDGAISNGEAEVSPHVVADLHARLVIADRRHRLRADVDRVPAAASSSHTTPVAAGPSVYTRRRCTT